MISKSLDYARYVTFQRPLGPVASKLSAMTTAAPSLKLILPFVRTPTNLIKFAGERSPFAPMMESWRKDFAAGGARRDLALRSEEHTSELQSLMRISYAVFCLKKKKLLATKLQYAYTPNNQQNSHKQ